MQYYVYEHWRPDTGLPFYVGKGKGNRANTTQGRNSGWREVVAILEKRALKFEVRFVDIGLTEREAFVTEMERIAFLRAQGVVLVNKTNGGDGCWGLKVTKETRQKLRDRQYTDEHRQRIAAALKDKPKSEEHCKNLSIARTGVPIAKFSSESKARMSVAQKKRQLSPEIWVKIKAAVSAAQKGRVPSEESRLKMSVSQTGRTHSEETKQKMRLKALEREARKRELGITQKGHVGFKHSEETKQKLSVAALERATRNREEALLARVASTSNSKKENPMANISA